MAIQNGGWIMIALGFCSISAVALVLQVMYQIKTMPLRCMHIQRMRQGLTAQSKESVIASFQKMTHPTVQLAILGLKHMNDLSALQDASQRLMGQISNELTKKLPFISLIIRISPVLGLLGTVVGLMDVFLVIGMNEGLQKMSQLSSGISTALISTVIGLCISIPLMVVLTLLNRSIDKRLMYYESIPGDFSLYCLETQSE